MNDIVLCFCLGDMITEDMERFKNKNQNACGRQCQIRVCGGINREQRLLVSLYEIRFSKMVYK